MYDTKKARYEEFRMDWAITLTKAIICLRRFKCTHDFKWIDLAERHLQTGNGLVAEIDRVSHSIADPVDWIGAERVGV